MDQLLKLAQLYNFCGKSTARKFDIAKGVDVNYCIPDDATLSEKNRNYFGYNCLHIAALKSHQDLSEYFISRGADLLKQGTFNGYTPLHVAVNKYYSKKSLKSAWEVAGLLQMDRSVDILLSAHVKTKNPMNPKDKNGISHFHIACMFNNVEAVKYFLKIGESVDQATNADSNWPGYTPLHFAIQYSSVQAAQVLLKHGGDIHKEDIKGSSSLNLAIQRLIDIKNFELMGKGVFCLFFKEETQRINDLICLMFQTINNSNHTIHVYKNGLTNLHVACIIEEISILENILETNCNPDVVLDSDCRYWQGWTPLHFAAYTSHEKFNLLLTYGAKIDVKNSKGETPFDLFMRRFSLKVVHSILSTKQDLVNIVLSDNETKLGDLLLAMSDIDSFDDFLNSLKNIDISLPLDSPIWPSYTILHLALLSNNKFMQCLEFHEKTDFDESCSDSFKVEKDLRYWNIIQKCLNAGCNVTAKNGDGQTTIHMAFKLLNKPLLKELLKYCNDDVNIENLSVFHIACIANDIDCVKRLLDKNLDINLAVKGEIQWYKPEYKCKPDKEAYEGSLIVIKANSTALHMVVFLENEIIVELLAKNGANIYAKDSSGSTPLHLSASMFNKPSFAKLLLSATPDLHDSVNNDGLTHVHVAAFANDEKALRKLIRNGVNIEAVASSPESFTGQTPLHIAANLGHSEGVKVLIEAGTNIHLENTLKKYETPLLYAVNSCSLETAKCFKDKLKLMQCNVDIIDPSGLTLLHLACATLDLKLAKQLLKNGSDPNAQIRTDFDFHLAGFTPLHILMYYVKVYVNLKSVYFKNFIVLLLEYGADVTITSNKGFSPLHLGNRVIAYRHNKFEIASQAVKLMLNEQISYEINPLDDSGFSHFHLACKLNQVEVIEKFLQCGVDIEHATDPFASSVFGYNGLHFAIVPECLDAARLLIFRGANVNSKNSLGQTVFHRSMLSGLNDLDFIKMLVNYGADIHAKSSSDKTPLLCLIQMGELSLKKLQFFLSRGCTIDNMYIPRSSEGIIGLALESAAQAEEVLMLETLIETCQLQDKINHGFNAIHNVVATHNEGDKLTVDTYLEIILRFIDMGCDIDQQEHGNTAVHEAVFLENVEAVDALLRLGADINVTNSEESFPLRTFMDQSAGRFWQQSFDCQSFKILKLLAVYAKKIKMVGLHLHESNERNADAVLRVSPLSSDFEDVYQQEMTKMEKKTVGSCFVPKDFLTNRALVAEYPTMPLAKREAIVKFFTNIGIVCHEYPEFCGPLLMKYRQIENRMKIWQEAKNSLLFLSPVELPDLCSEAVLYCLTNDEVKVIISASNMH